MSKGFRCWELENIFAEYYAAIYIVGEIMEFQADSARHSFVARVDRQ